MSEATGRPDGDRPEGHDGLAAGLPFDLRTLLLGLWRRWPVAAVFIGVSLAAGALLAVAMGQRTYEVETVLLNRPQMAAQLGDEFAPPPLQTQVHLVTIQANLEAVREKLRLPVTTRRLEAAVEVDVRSRTQLMVITVKWSDPETAAAIANTLRDVFLQKQLSVRKAEARGRVADVEGRLAVVKRDLVVAEAALHEFTTTNKVVDLSKEAQWYLEEMVSVGALLEKAKVDKISVDLQVENLGRIVRQLQDRAKTEMQSSSELQGLGDINIRVERLRRAIYDDREQRANTALLAEKEVALARARELKEKGIVSQAELDSAVADYERQKALTVDTAKIKEMKTELDRLNDLVIPTGKEENTASGQVLREMMLKDFQLQLEMASAGEKVKHLEGLYASVKKKLDTLPDLQRKYVTLTREVGVMEAEKKALEEMLSKVRLALDSEATDFSVESVAQPIRIPSRSTRKVIFLGVFVVGSGLGFVVIVALELLDTRIKSGGELKARVGVEAAGEIPFVWGGPSLFPGDRDPPLIETFKILARHVRLQSPKRGARIMIASATHGEGKTLVAANLACCFGRQDERVLLVDAQVRGHESRAEGPRFDMRELIAGAPAGMKGLGEYLSFQTDNMDDVVAPTTLAGVECLPQVGEAVIPDLLGSNIMKDLLLRASERYSVTLVEAPPVLPYVDAESLAQWMDAILLVVRARTCTAAALRKAVARLSTAGTPIIGAVLNGVDSFYMERVA